MLVLVTSATDCTPSWCDINSASCDRCRFAWYACADVTIRSDIFGLVMVVLSGIYGGVIKFGIVQVLLWIILKKHLCCETYCLEQVVTSYKYPDTIAILAARNFSISMKHTNSTQFQ